MAAREHDGVDLSDLDEIDIPTGFKFEKLGFRSFAGIMPKVTFVVPFPEIAERFTFDRLLSRHDYDIDDESTPGNRDLAESHWRRILEGIRSTDRPYLGTLTVAIDKQYCDVKLVRKVSEFIDLVLVRVSEGAPNPVVEDGQHRIKMAASLWQMVKDAVDGPDAEIRAYLEKTSVEMTMLLEGQGDILSTIFVRMGSTKPISPNLIAIMDRSSVQNRLGLYVTKHSRLLADRVSYLSVRSARAQAAAKGRPFDDLYPAAAVRSAACSMAGVGVRDRSPDQREGLIVEIVDTKAKSMGKSRDAAIETVGKEIVANLDYAYRRLPGWSELATSRISVAEFKKKYIHASAAGLHVIANVIAAARSQGLSPRQAIDAMAEIPWERDALRDAKNDLGEKIKVHKFFEGTLTKTVFDLKTGDWRAGTAGATRSSYEPAIDKVLRHIANSNPALKSLSSHDAFVSIGLASSKGRGRPRKTAVA